jgi:hypothetical protein
MPETIRCRVKGCNKAIHAENFEDGMYKLRRHRAKCHPKAFRTSVRKSIVTRKRNKK